MDHLFNYTVIPVKCLEKKDGGIYVTHRIEKPGGVLGFALKPPLWPYAKFLRVENIWLELDEMASWKGRNAGWRLCRGLSQCTIETMNQAIEDFCNQATGGQE